MQIENEILQYDGINPSFHFGMVTNNYKFNAPHIKCAYQTGVICIDIDCICTAAKSLLI